MNKFRSKWLSLVGRYCQHLAWSDRETRERIQRPGANIVPINFYSDTPSIHEIETSYEYATKEPPYSDAEMFDVAKFRQTVEWLMEFSAEFDPPVDGDERTCRRYFWKNSAFSCSDAMAYYCFIRRIRPATIVEIGSGFSTLIALEAIEKNGAGAVQCIEPFPREFLKNDDRITLHAVKAQDIQPEFLNDTLQDNDILFIDSTHTVKTGSDCLHIYLRLLPKIKGSSGNFGK